jgi:hypothetical protein
MMLNEELNRLRDEYDALRHESHHKDSQLEEMEQKVLQLHEGFDRVGEGRPVTIKMDFKEMTTDDQEDLVMASKVGESLRTNTGPTLNRRAESARLREHST